MRTYRVSRTTTITEEWFTIKAPSASKAAAVAESLIPDNVSRRDDTTVDGGPEPKKIPWPDLVSEKMMAGIDPGIAKSVPDPFSTRKANPNDSAFTTGSTSVGATREDNYDITHPKAEAVVHDEMTPPTREEQMAAYEQGVRERVEEVKKDLGLIDPELAGYRIVDGKLYRKADSVPFVPDASSKNTEEK
jgi:hypothetical protein